MINNSKIDYWDEEVEQVTAFAGPAISFSHIEADNVGLRPYQNRQPSAA